MQPSPKNELIDEVVNEYIDYVMELDQHQEYKTKGGKIKRAFLEDFIPALFKTNKFSNTLECLAKWLDAREDNLRATLKKSYQENTDYKFEEDPRTKKITTDLTGNCFQRLALASKAPNAEQVRSYFILMEKMYRNFMVEKMSFSSHSEDETV